MNADSNVGKLIHESPKGSIGKRTWTLVGFICVILLVVVMPIAFPDEYFTTKGLIAGIIGTFAFLIIMFSSSTDRIRIYESGISGPTAFLPFWPKPIHLNEMDGYKIEKNIVFKFYFIYLRTGKKIKFTTDNYDTKTNKIFEDVIISKIKALPD